MQKELWGWKKWIYFRDAMLPLLLLPGLTDADAEDGLFWSSSFPRPAAATRGRPHF